jgi:hypothetical protein
MSHHMKKILLILLLSSTAFGAISIKKFTCSLSKRPQETFTFKIKNLGTSRAELLSSKSFHGPVYTSSRNLGLHRIVETLNAQGGDLRKKPSNLQLVGEQIGCDYVWLNLSKKHAYSAGTLRADFQCSDQPIFRDRVSCRIK